MTKVVCFLEVGLQVKGGPEWIVPVFFSHNHAKSLKLLMNCQSRTVWTSDIVVTTGTITAALMPITGTGMIPKLTTATTLVWPCILRHVFDEVGVCFAFIHMQIQDRYIREYWQWAAQENSCINLSHLDPVYMRNPTPRHISTLASSSIVTPENILGDGMGIPGFTWVCQRWKYSLAAVPSRLPA